MYICELQSVSADNLPAEPPNKSVIFKKKSKLPWQDSNLKPPAFFALPYELLARQLMHYIVADLNPNILQCNETAETV